MTKCTLGLASASGFGLAMLAGMTVVVTPSEAQRTVLPRGSQVDTFCPGNRVTNPHFTDVARPHLINQANSITEAAGWTGPWRQSTGSHEYETADAWSAAQVPTFFTQPTPVRGNYAAMWLSNRAAIEDVVYREGMMNRLLHPIMRSTGIYNLTVDIAAVRPPSGPAPSFIGIYGVIRAPNGVLPYGPAGLRGFTLPANLNLYTNPERIILLGTIEVPASATAAWQTYTLQFNSATLPQHEWGVNHLIITKLDGASPATQTRYLAFDDFCLQTLAEAGIAPPPANAQ